ncbi:branched-chain amino acid ABC transporter ATP-binding protein/permease [Bradyrhizobium sp. 23AC]
MVKNLTLAGMPRMARTRASYIFGVGLFAALAVFGSLPFFQPPAFVESFLYLIFFWIALATSWTILSGFSGYVSFGHGTFYGIGIYSVARLSEHMPLTAAILLAGILSAVVAIVIGAIVFRIQHLRGELFALLTLASTFILSTIVLNTPIDGGPGVSLLVSVPSLFGSQMSTLYLMGMSVALLSVAVAYSVQYSSLGRGLFAVADDESVAEAQGIPTFAYKLAAFAISAFLAGVAGGIHALFISYVTVGETFSITVPLYVLLMSVLGGTRHWAGPCIGATLIASATYLFVSGDYALVTKIAIGATLVVATLVMPGGIMGVVSRFRRINVDQTTAVAGEGKPIRQPPGVGPAGASPESVLLKCEGISLAFSGLRALSQVSFEVRENEILGLVGPNGSGKSTLINVISGFYRPDEGHVFLEGRDVAYIGGHRVARAGIARTYQIPRPFARLSVRENVELAAMFGAAASNPQRAADEADYWLAFVGLADRADALPSEINLHQRKFLELARALATQPRLIMLDEVLAGLTPPEVSKAIDMVRRIRDTGTSIIFVEHNMRAVMELSDRLIVINQGKKIADGPPRQVMNQDDVVSAYLGVPHVAA